MFSNLIFEDIYLLGALNFKTFIRVIKGIIKNEKIKPIGIKTVDPT